MKEKSSKAILIALAILGVISLADLGLNLYAFTKTQAQTLPETSSNNDLDVASSFDLSETENEIEKTLADGKTIVLKPDNCPTTQLKSGATCRNFTFTKSLRTLDTKSSNIIYLNQDYDLVKKQLILELHDGAYRISQVSSSPTLRFVVFDLQTKKITQTLTVSSNLFNDLAIPAGYLKLDYHISVQGNHHIFVEAYDDLNNRLQDTYVYKYAKPTGKNAEIKAGDMTLVTAVPASHFDLYVTKENEITALSSDAGEFAIDVFKSDNSKTNVITQDGYADKLIVDSKSRIIVSYVGEGKYNLKRYDPVTKNLVLHGVQPNIEQGSFEIRTDFNPQSRVISRLQCGVMLCGHGIYRTRPNGKGVLYNHDEDSVVNRDDYAFGDSLGGTLYMRRKHNEDNRNTRVIYFNALGEYKVINTHTVRWGFQVATDTSNNFYISHLKEGVLTIDTLQLN